MYWENAHFFHALFFLTPGVKNLFLSSTSRFLYKKTQRNVWSIGFGYKRDFLLSCYSKLVIANKIHYMYVVAITVVTNTRYIVETHSFPDYEVKKNRSLSQFTQSKNKATVWYCPLYFSPDHFFLVLLKAFAISN